MALQLYTSSGAPLTSDLEHALITGPFSTTSTSPEIFHPNYAMDTTCDLLKLSVELRYRIYGYAFEGAGYAVVQRDDKTRKCHSASSLPIGFIGACPLLQAEVEQWMTYSLRATLVSEDQVNAQTCYRSFQDATSIESTTSSYTIGS